MKSVLNKARKLHRREGGGTITRPEGFELAFVRPRPLASEVPVVVIPGGPGMASVVPYKGFRKLATDLDVIMVEHRGVGLSRTMPDGRDLPVEAVTVEEAADDIAAVLDDQGIERAIIHGASYGTYLAQAFAARHPERVETLVLDSPMFDIENDITVNTAYRRQLLDGELGPLLRELIDSGVDAAQLSHVVQVVYEFAGPESLARLLNARLNGKATRLWNFLAGLGTNEIDGDGIRGYLEPELVAGIAFGQLGFGLPGDGGPLDPQMVFAPFADKRPQYQGEPFNFPEFMETFDRPVVVACGVRDLRTPVPVGQRIADVAHNATLIIVPDQGHSLLDTHQLALVTLLRWVVAGDKVEGRGGELAGKPRKGNSAILGTLLRAAIRATTRPIKSE